MFKKGLIVVKIFSIFILVFSLLSCSNSSDIKIYSLSQEKVRIIEGYIDTAMDKYNMPGVIVGIWSPDQGNWVSAKGFSNIASSEKISPNFHVRIGSITKTFTTTVILQLVDEGKIKLDDSLYKFVSQIPNSQNITIKQICNNTSGLFDYFSDIGFYNTYVQNPQKKWEPRQLIDIAIKHEPYFLPGKDFRYSNTNFILQGMIIEQLTKNTVENEIYQRIIRPLNLKNTYFPTDTKMPVPYVHGYMENENKDLYDITSTEPSYTWTAGAMISNLEDLKIWAQALGEGDLISEKIQKERLTGSGHSPVSWYQYGLGIAFFKDFIGHDGGVHGYTSAMFYLPEKKATIIIFGNNMQGFGADALFYKISQLLYPQQAPPITLISPSIR